MYKVYANGKPLHHPNMFDSGYVVSEPEITQEVNAHGSMTFDMLPNHPLYGSINNLTTIITVEDDTGEIFRGRVLHSTKDFYNRKSVYVEGELAFLVDTLYRPFVFKGSVSEFFTLLIENHNSQVEDEKKFTVGLCTVTDPNDYIVRESIDPTSTWDAITYKLIDLLGGYIRTRYENGVRYIDYLTSYDSTSGQKVEFGKNMLDLKDYVTAEDVITCLIPYGVQYDEGDEGYTEQPESGTWNGNRLTVESVNSGLDYIKDKNGVSLFGNIWGTMTWDDVTLPDNLLTKAIDYLAESIYAAMTLTITALDLHLVNVDTASIKLGDDVQIFSIPHDINRTLMCVSKKIRLMEPDQDEITLGAKQETLTQQVVIKNTTKK